MRMEPLQLFHSWPLSEQRRRFREGRVIDVVATDMESRGIAAIGPHRVGSWDCDLADDSLVWSPGVYDIFGLPRGATISRDEAVALYCEESRAAMERLRAYAIKHKRGFTLDAEIRPAAGEQRRWMRLIAAPVCVDDKAIRLSGLKLLI